MNREKLMKMANTVRTGGKGTVRGKKKAVHKTTTTNDKRLQSTLKRIGVNSIPAIEEVNSFKDDAVIQFINPKVQTSIAANTWVVSSTPQSKSSQKHNIDGRLVEAKRAVPKDDQNMVNRSNSSSIQGSPGGPSRTRKIFVGGLPSSVRENDFKTYFEQFGTTTDVVVMYDHNTKRPRVFGFITYDSEEALEKGVFVVESVSAMLNHDRLLKKSNTNHRDVKS